MLGTDIRYVVSSCKEITGILKQIIGFLTLFSLIIMCIYISLLLNLLINFSIFTLLRTAGFHPSARHSYRVTRAGAFRALDSPVIPSHPLFLLTHLLSGVIDGPQEVCSLGMRPAVFL